jgi:hypothetical protein
MVSPGNVAAARALALLRFAILGLMIPVLVGCDPGWSIDRASVNPSGNAPPGPVEIVSPLTLVAPPDFDSRSTQDVSIETVFRRSSYTGQIWYKITVSYTGQATGHPTFYSTRARRVGSSNRTTQVILTADCRRVQASIENVVRLDVRSRNSSTGDGTIFSSSSVDKIAMQIAVAVASSSDQGGSDTYPVIWFAPKPLDIACWSDSSMG